MWAPAECACHSLVPDTTAQEKPAPACQGSLIDARDLKLPCKQPRTQPLLLQTRPGHDSAQCRTEDLNAGLTRRGSRGARLARAG